MKNGVLICVILLSLSATQAGVVETGAFQRARRIGEANERSFFLFSTSVGQYAIRHDGMGEANVNGRRRVFYLRLGMIGRIEQVYFHEHQGDLVLLYEVSDGRGGLGYIGRMNQQSRKMRWLTPIKEHDLGSCVVEANHARCGASGELTKIDLKTGVTTPVE